jgi:hypothetical protein
MNNLSKYLVLLVIAVISCNPKKSNIEKGLIDIQLLKDLELNIPDMQTAFRTAPQRFKKYLIYQDPFNESIIALNSDFSFNKTLIKKGEAPNEILNIYSFSITDEFVFIIGPNVVVVFDESLKLLGKYPFSLDMAYSVFKWNGGFLTAGFNEEDKHFSLYSFDFSRTATSIELVKQLEVESKYIEERMYYSQKLINISNSRFLLIFDWYGEYFLFDKAYNTIKTDLLPFSGDMDFFLDESVVKPPYYQAYDSYLFNDSLVFIIRELDFNEIGQDLSDEEVILKNYRNTISVFNKDMLFLNSIKLPNAAVNLSVLQDTLITNDFNSEKIYLYEINMQ